MNSLGLSLILKMGCFCSKEYISVNNKRLLIKDTLGEGGFSTVYLTEDSHHKVYAVKKIICHSIEDQTIAVNEAKAHSKVQHSNVVKLIDFGISGMPDPVTNTTSCVYLILPFYERGTLLNELEKRAVSKNHIEEKRVLKLFLQICEGIKAFHELTTPLAHRDIKTANILLDVDDTPIIMDLGSTTEARVIISSSSDAQKLQDTAAERCSMPYRAPELFNVESHCVIDERTDIWSLGCLLYAMCYFKSPFDAVYERGDSVALAVMNGKINFPSNDIYSQEMHNLVMFMLKTNPMERPFIFSVIENTTEILNKFEPSV